LSGRTSGKKEMTEKVETVHKKILVADDNEGNRALARAALEDEGYVVVLANDGDGAVQAFERETPDCAVLDIRMPGMDGFRACARIRALPGGAETPILFLTALRDVDTFDQALQAGGDDFLTKPVRPAELVARVQAALTLRQMRVDLRDHYTLLKRQRDDLQRLQLQKERLTAFLVHDLKNPVNSMDLHAQLLLRDKTLSPLAMESATQIRNEARQLNRMILNLLDVSKGDEGKLGAQRADVDLRALIDEVVSEVAASAEVRNLRLETSMKVDRLSADPELLRRVLVNLVENAIRHAPSRTIVRVGATLTDRTVELSVADSGAGISEHLRERVFDPFVQLDNASESRSRGGRGLGLAFCRVAVEAHGGSIRVEDAQPGALFRLSIPQ